SPTETGNALVDECLANGKAFVYSGKWRTGTFERLDERLAAGELTQRERNNLARLSARMSARSSFCWIKMSALLCAAPMVAVSMPRGIYGRSDCAGSSSIPV